MLVLIVSKFGQIIIKEAWYPHQHYSVFYIRRILMTSGKMSIVQVCYTYLAEIGGFRKKVFSLGPFHFTYNSLIATSFAIPFYLGEFIGGYQWFNIYAVYVAAYKGHVDMSENEVFAYGNSPAHLTVALFLKSETLRTRTEKFSFLCY